MSRTGQAPKSPIGIQKPRGKTGNARPTGSRQATPRQDTKGKKGGAKKNSSTRQPTPTAITDLTDKYIADTLEEWRKQVSDPEYLINYLKKHGKKKHDALQETIRNASQRKKNEEAYKELLKLARQLKSIEIKSQRLFNQTKDQRRDLLDKLKKADDREKKVLIEEYEKYMINLAQETISQNDEPRKQAIAFFAICYMAASALISFGVYKMYGALPTFVTITNYTANLITRYAPELIGNMFMPFKVYSNTEYDHTTGMHIEPTMAQFFFDLTSSLSSTQADFYQQILAYAIAAKDKALGAAGFGLVTLYWNKLKNWNTTLLNALTERWRNQNINKELDQFNKLNPPSRSSYTRTSSQLALIPRVTGTEHASKETAQTRRKLVRTVLMHTTFA